MFKDGEHVGFCTIGDLPDLYGSFDEIALGDEDHAVVASTVEGLKLLSKP